MARIESLQQARNNARKLENKGYARRGAVRVSLFAAYSQWTYHDMDGYRSFYLDAPTFVRRHAQNQLWIARVGCALSKRPA